MANVLAIVPARGGSKGIANKNLKELGGKPLIAHVIEAAKKASLVSRIVCTTDSEDIRDAAISYGAEAPFLRPVEWATDTAPVYPALVHAAKTFGEMTGFEAEYVVTLQPTYPLIQSEHIDAAVEKAIINNADSVITAVPLDHDCHPYNIRTEGPDGQVRFWMDKEHYQFPTRQSKPPFLKFGNLFVTKRATLLDCGRLEGEKNFAIVIDKIFSLDINTPEDFDEIVRIIETRISTV